jgi:hypothetical protein
MSHYRRMSAPNVLSPAPETDALMELSVTDLFKIKYTAEIHRR